MVKVQRFLTEQRQALVIGLTVLLILAEAFRFISSNNLMYQILMAIAGVIGLLPILFTAVSSLEVRLISIDVLVSIAVVIDEDGNTSDEDVDFIDPGDMVLIKTGNQVPVDGTIKTGTAVLNEAS